MTRQKMKLCLWSLVLLLSVRLVEGAKTDTQKLALAITVTCTGFVFLMLIFLVLWIIQKRTEREVEVKKTRVRQLPIQREIRYYGEETMADIDWSIWNNRSLNMRATSSTIHSDQLDRMTESDIGVPIAITFVPTGDRTFSQGENSDSGLPNMDENFDLRSSNDEPFPESLPEKLDCELY